MTASDQRVVVFVDTSYIRQKAKGQSAEWNRLLLLARNREIEIHVSHIAIEEYRSQCVDHLYAKIERSRNALRDLQKEWQSNPIAGELGEPIEPNIFPDIEKLEDEANKMKETLVTENHLTVRMPSASQGERVWSDYFSWRSIFRFVTPANRDDRTTRDSRRKNIPDAWIYESAVDLSKEKPNVVCLCCDQKLTELLSEQGLKVCASADDVQLLLEGGDISAEEMIADEAIELTGDRKVELSPLRERLDSIERSEKQLQLRILGYTHFFSPISKSNLIELLEERGHASTEIEIVASRLVLNSLIKDSGTHYISVDRIIGKEAASEVMEEIVEKL